EKPKPAGEGRGGLRVLGGDSTAIVSTADLSAGGLAELARDAVMLARATAHDRYAGLPDPQALATEQPDLGLYDPASESLDTDACLALARDAEAAGPAGPPGDAHSGGAGVGG